MTKVVRFSVSLERVLLKRFQRYCREERFATRSEAIRQLIHDSLARRAWVEDAEDVAGTLTLVYDHDRKQLRDQLIKLQHDHHDVVISTLHAHLTHDLCLEVILLRGPARQLREIAARLRGLKGVHKGELVIATVAQEGPPESHRAGV